jgi:hypothetical protein
MKTLNKLQINPEKLMKNEELIALKGGTNCVCKYLNGGYCATGAASSGEECHYMCIAAGCDGSWIFGSGY